MRFLLSADHHNFFAKNGFISFDNVISHKDLENLRKEVELQAEVTPERFDLFRKSSLLKKFIKSAAPVRLIQELFRTPLFRVGYDAWVEKPQELPSGPLQGISPAKPLVGALLIPLSATSDTIFCVSCTRPLNWKEFLNEEPYYLIMYADKNATYYLEPCHSQKHAWKLLGYAFGDKLTQEHHPLCK